MHECYKTITGFQGYLNWKHRTRIRCHLARSILAPYWDELASAIFWQGYTWYTVQRTIAIARAFAAYAEAQGVGDAGELTGDLAENYLEERQLREGRRCLGFLISFLRERGVLPATLAPPEAPEHELLDEYVRFLREHRGIGVGRIKEHRRQIRAFLGSLGPSAALSTIKTLDAPAVFRFVTHRASALTRSQRKSMCASLRSFLRFLCLRGYVQRDLSSTVPVIPSFKLDRVPHALSREDISRILDAVDRSTRVGRRDYAILLVLATYGIRNRQLCGLRLDDVDWQRETLRVRAAKGGRAVVLPLRPAVGEAIIDYLRDGRPPWPLREIFLRMRAPMGPLRGNLINIIRTYARKAGVVGPHIGPRAWRHACATRILAEGHSLKTIGDMLGHRSVESTFVYTKVDVESLRQAALEWPEVTP